MPRMFAEDWLAVGESRRAGVARLMAALDDEAAKVGHVVRGDVTISEGESPLMPAPFVRLEAEVVPR